MDNFWRVIRNGLALALGVLLGGLSVYSYADTTALTFKTPAPWSTSAASATAACSAAAGTGSFTTYWANYGWVYHGISGLNCQARYQGSAQWGTVGEVRTFTTAFEFCPSGYTSNGSLCVSDAPDCTAGQKATLEFFVGWGTAGGTVSDGSGHVPGQICDGSCLKDKTSVDQCQTHPDAPTKYYCDFTYTTNGGSCSTPTDTSDNSSPCPPGYGVGTVNGVTSCLPSANTPSDSTSKTTNKTTNPDGSTTTTETSKNADGTTQTTTTTTDANGNSTSTTETAPDPLRDFCKANPQSPLCKAAAPNSFCEENPETTICKTSQWSGACDAFACDGDAIQCAIAREQHDRNCTLFVKPTNLSDLGNAVSSGNDPESANHPQNKPPEDFNVRDRFASASGSRWLASNDLPPVSFNVMGTSFSMDTTLLSNFFRVIGYVFVAIAGVIGVRIVGGAQS